MTRPIDKPVPPCYAPVIDCAAVVVHAHREALGSTGENAIKNARAKREAIRKLSLAYDNAKANDREQP